MQYFAATTHCGLQSNVADDAKFGPTYAPVVHVDVPSDPVGVYPTSHPIVTALPCTTEHAPARFPSNVYPVGRSPAPVQ